MTGQWRGEGTGPLGDGGQDKLQPVGDQRGRPGVRGLERAGGVPRLQGVKSDEQTGRPGLGGHPVVSAEPDRQVLDCIDLGPPTVGYGPKHLGVAHEGGALAHLRLQGRGRTRVRETLGSRL